MKITEHGHIHPDHSGHASPQWVIVVVAKDGQCTSVGPVSDPQDAHEYATSEFPEGTQWEIVELRSPA